MSEIKCFLLARNASSQVSTSFLCKLLRVFSCFGCPTKRSHCTTSVSNRGQHIDFGPALPVFGLWKLFAFEPGENLSPPTHVNNPGENHWTQHHENTIARLWFLQPGAAHMDTISRSDMAFALIPPSCNFSQTRAQNIQNGAKVFCPSSVALMCFLSQTAV